MSVQVAKSGSGTNPPGRRIQMSLSGSTKSNKADTEKDLNTKETQSNNKTVTKNDNTTENKTKSDANKKATENDANNKKSSDNSNAKDKGNNDDKKKGNKSDKNQNGVNEVKTTTNGHKVDDSKKSNEEKNEKVEKNEKAEKKTTRADNLRQKEGKEKDEKKESKVQEKTEESTSSNDKKTSNKNEEVKEKPKEDKTKKDNDESKKPITIDEEVIEIEDDIIEIPQNPPETPKKSEKKPKENEISEKKTKEKEISPNVKLTQEAPKSIPSPTRIGSKSEIEDEEEMESLIFEVDNTDTHGPLETSTPGKILKYNYSPSLSEHKKLRKETFQAPIEYDQPKYAITSSSVSSSSEKPAISTSSYRSISGRRSLRPMKDYSFQSMYRESYRKINTELDYTTSSMNVTVGSEIPSETTFSFFGRGKKRERTPPASYSTVETQQADIDLSPKSPKRPRLDLSGLFGIVSSPITLLRARFTKTKIESSTPNGKLTSKDDNEEVENVSVITSEEVATNETANTQDEEDVNIKDIETEEMNEIKEPIDVDLPDNDNVAVDIKSEEAISSSTQTLNKKRMCSVM